MCVVLCITPIVSHSLRISTQLTRPSLCFPSPARRRRLQVEEVLHRGQSEFQTVEVVKTVPFGSLLITDGLMQSSEVDEYVYHQSLVHPALTAHPNPKKVLIAGGGEVRCPKQLFSDTLFVFALSIVRDDYIQIKAREAAAALVGAHGEAPGGSRILWPLRSL